MHPTVEDEEEFSSTEIEETDISQRKRRNNIRTNKDIIHKGFLSFQQIKENMKEEDEEEFSSTEKEENELNQKKRRKRTRRRSNKITKVRENDVVIFQVEL